MERKFRSLIVPVVPLGVKEPVEEATVKLPSLKPLAPKSTPDDDIEL